MRLESFIFVLILPLVFLLLFGSKDKMRKLEAFEILRSTLAQQWRWLFSSSWEHIRWVELSGELNVPKSSSVARSLFFFVLLFWNGNKRMRWESKGCVPFISWVRKSLHWNKCEFESFLFITEKTRWVVDCMVGRMTMAAETAVGGWKSRLTSYKRN